MSNIYIYVCMLDMFKYFYMFYLSMNINKGEAVVKMEKLQ